MNFNQTDIGLLLLITSVTLLAILLFLLALPTLMDKKSSNKKMKP